jgi:hypothetical protein
MQRYGRQPRGGRSGSRVPWVPLVGVALVIIILFAAGFMVGVGLGLIPGGPGVSTHPPSPVGPGPDSTANPASPGLPVVTSERTSLEFIETYTECGCATRDSRLAGVELAGMTAEDLALVFPGYAVQSFAADQAVLFKLTPGMCPDMTVYRTLGVRDGRVAVFYGRPGTGLMLQRLTTIEVIGLPAADRERLATGIVLPGDSAVERFLEGLSD